MSYDCGTSQINALPPFYYLAGCRKVFGKSAKGGDTIVCDVRGQGYLTGAGDGALGLTQREADEIIDRTGEAIASALNERFPTATQEAGR